MYVYGSVTIRYTYIALHGWNRCTCFQCGSRFGLANLRPLPVRLNEYPRVIAALDTTTDWNKGSSSSSEQMMPASSSSSSWRSIPRPWWLCLSTLDRVWCPSSCRVVICHVRSAAMMTSRGHWVSHVCHRRNAHVQSGPCARVYGGQVMHDK